MRSLRLATALWLALGSAAANAAEIAVTDQTFQQNEALFARAVNEQLGVIGDDFGGAVKLGDVRNVHGWVPIDGFKRSFAGFLTSLYGTGKFARDDWVFGVELPGDNALVRANVGKLTAAKPDDLVGRLKGVIDPVGDKAYIATQDVYSGRLPAASIDSVGFFGPWVFRKKLLKTGIEIHPLSQLWWTRKTSTGRVFHLRFLNDLSGRFAHTNDFEGPDKTTGASWQGAIRSGSNRAGTFAVAFETDETRLLRLTVPGGRTAPEDRIRVLRGGKPVVDVGIGSLIKQKVDVRLADVGLDRAAKARGKSVIRGFLVVTTKPSGKAVPIESDVGSLDVTVTAETLPEANTKRVRVTLVDIACLGADDSGGVEEILGYVGVRATTGTWPRQASFVPNRSSTDTSPGSPILWSRRDDDDLGQIDLATRQPSKSLRLRKNQTETIGKSLLYDLPESAMLTLLADLDEDDESDDKNPTKLDGDDDRLEKFCKTCFRNVEVRSLKVGQPLPVEFKLGSGGTLVRVTLKVERLS